MTAYTGIGPAFLLAGSIEPTGRDPEPQTDAEATGFVRGRRRGHRRAIPTDVTQPEARIAPVLTRKAWATSMGLPAWGDLRWREVPGTPAHVAGLGVPAAGGDLRRAWARQPVEGGMIIDIDAEQIERLLMLVRKKDDEIREAVEFLRSWAKGTDSERAMSALAERERERLASIIAKLEAARAA